MCGPFDLPTQVTINRNIGEATYRHVDIMNHPALLEPLHSGHCTARPSADMISGVHVASDAQLGSKEIQLSLHSMETYSYT